MDTNEFDTRDMVFARKQFESSCLIIRFAMQSRRRKIQGGPEPLPSRKGFEPRHRPRPDFTRN
ncbi:hypothetical protein [Singulisphaera sp. PoT]|uniref:hypothetical protein n=1 Tax=Singulisphaera sp. PoT TaxID=3411797 RepID=UPI003BF5BC45